MSTVSPVETEVSRAGGVRPSRAAVRVPAHFGSPAGELAACLRAVGLADRSDLGVLTMTGGGAGLSDLVQHATGVQLAVGGVVATADAWWCRAATDRVVTVTEPAARARILRSLGTPAARLHGLEVHDASEQTAAIAVAGRRTAGVLLALGALGPSRDPRGVPPFTTQSIAGTPVQLLLQSDRRALVLASTGSAERVWHAIESAGRAFGLSFVGTEALRLLALHERTATAQAGGPHHS